MSDTNLEKYEQQSLFSNVPLSKAYPSRALSKDETYLIVAIRYYIQEALRNNTEDITKPIVFQVNIKDLAREKGIAHLATFKKNILRSAETLQNNIPTETINFTLNGRKKRYIMPLVAGIVIGEDGDVTVKVNPDYQQYFMEYVLSNPELQIEKKFFLYSKCKYSYPLSNWLIARIAEERSNNNNFSKNYHIIAPFEEIQKKVPASSSKMCNSNYMIKVIRAAVDDINANQFSVLRILNDDFVAKRNGRQIVDLFFDVELSLTERSQVFISHPALDDLDAQDVPSWEYILARLKSLGVNKNFSIYVQKYPRIRAWRALLYTMLRGQDAPYFNKIYKTLDEERSVKELAAALKLAHPELCDDIIDGILMRDQIAFQEDDATFEHTNFSLENSDSPIKDALVALKNKHCRIM